VANDIEQILKIAVEHHFLPANQKDCVLNFLAGNRHGGFVNFDFLRH